MADEFAEKTEAPTPRRRAEAREQGQIARSPDLTSAVLLLTVIILLDWYGPGLIGALKGLMEKMLGSESLTDMTIPSISAGILYAIRTVAGAMFPLAVGVLLIAVLVNIMQVGLFFSLGRIQPKIEGLNPFKGISKLLGGSNNLMHLAMNVVKLILIGAVAYSAIHGRIGLILTTQQLEFIQIFGLGASVIYSIALRIGAVLLVLAILDYAWQKWHTEQKLKMSKQEIKEEMRSMEGDPQIKTRRRQIAMQIAKQGINKNVPTADVIVTNPTHFAVALKYDSDSMHAPKVVAKGTDHMAMLIRRIAIEHGIPILERPPLARALYRLVDVGHEIPEQFYSVVAEILAYVYELSGKLRQKRELMTA